MIAPGPNERWTVLLSQKEGALRAPRPRRRSATWLGAVVLAVLAVVLGTIGSLMTGYGPTESSPLTHALYNAIRCFSLNGPAEGNLAWPLDLARFLAPLATVWAAVAAFAGLSAAHRHERRVLRGRGHTLVCGLGPEGARLASESRDLGEQVIAIEADASNPAIAHLRTRGAVVLVGDAADPALLAHAGVARAGLLLSTLPSDHQNLSVALAARAAASAERPSGLPLLRAFVSCEDLELAEVARRHRLLADETGRVRIQLFNRHEAAARILTTDHLPAALALAAAERRAPHLAIVGLGRSGEAALLRILQAPIVHSYPALHVTVVDRHASARVARILSRRAILCARNGLGDLCTFEALDRELLEADELFDLLREVHARLPLDAVVSCVGDPELQAACVLEAAAGALPGVPVFLRLRDPGGLGSLFGEADTALHGGRRATVFGADHEVCSRAVVVDRSLDNLARRIHEEYRERRLALPGGAGDAAGAPWEVLDPDLVRSNVSQADHIPVKLAALGRRATRAASRGEPVPFAPAEVGILARLEHARWAAERILSGWSYAAGAKDVVRRTSPDLRAWEALDDPTRELDRAPVREIPRRLALLGIGISEPQALDGGAAPAGS